MNATAMNAMRAAAVLRSHPLTPSPSMELDIMPGATDFVSRCSHKISQAWQRGNYCQPGAVPRATVERRIASTYGRVIAGLAITGAVAAAASVFLPPLGFAGICMATAGSIACMLGAAWCKSSSLCIAKNAFWLGFTCLDGYVLAGLVAALSLPVLLQAAAGALVVAGVATGVAMLLPEKTFAAWQKPVAGALGILCLSFMLAGRLPAGIATSIYQGVSAATTLGVLGGSILCGTDTMLQRARSPHFDPIAESTLLQLPLSNLPFSRFLEPPTLLKARLNVLSFLGDTSTLPNRVCGWIPGLRHHEAENGEK